MDGNLTHSLFKGAANSRRLKKSSHLGLSNL